MQVARQVRAFLFLHRRNLFTQHLVALLCRPQALGHGIEAGELAKFGRAEWQARAAARCRSSMPQAATGRKASPDDQARPGPRLRPHEQKQGQEGQ